MGASILTTVQHIPVTLQQAWEFFSRPENLEKITPSHLGFKILSRGHSPQMYAGQIITYHVKPVLGIKLFWMTEITQVNNNIFFIDEQRIGPYKIWHHEHHFKQVDGGVEMTDVITFKSPWGILGNIADALFVRNKVKEIFNYRFTAVENLFGKSQVKSMELKVV
jgi:ligand-binding SRPBCC domain-containing protein